MTSSLRLVQLETKVTRLEVRLILASAVLSMILRVDWPNHIRFIEMEVF